MRLIDTHTLTLQEFIGNKIPQYAILSHTWEEEEVSFQDMATPDCQSKKGYEKIRMTCKLAAHQGLDWAWIDTCCIDKTSSAELTEAINSMFQWYQRAAVCYAYLSDLAEGTDLQIGLGRCRWFTRGWTLQELIAPLEMYFLDQTWNGRGSKATDTQLIERITGVPAQVLRGQAPLDDYCVALKMSWAANRVTTRIEDAAYCLLGIFGINMPLLYGEEERAFRRLQEEIIKITPDLSILAWVLPLQEQGQGNSEVRYTSVLAPSTSSFAEWRRGRLNYRPRQWLTDFSVTNLGIKLPGMGKISQTWEAPYFTTISVDCFHVAGAGLSMAVKLKICGYNQYVRADPHALTSWHPLPHTTTISQQRDTMPVYLRTHVPAAYGRLETVRGRSDVLRIRVAPEIYISTVVPPYRWDSHESLFFRRDYGQAMPDWGVLNLEYCNRNRPLKLALLVFGWSDVAKEARPTCGLVNYQHPMFFTQLQELMLQGTGIVGFQTFLRENRMIRSPTQGREIDGAMIQLMVTTEYVSDLDVCEKGFWEVIVNYNVRKVKKGLPWK